MDPATIATTIVTIFSPYLAKLGDSILDDIVSKMPETTGKLWKAITSRFKDNPAAKSATDDFIKNASDKDNQDTFALQLKKAIKDDDNFGKVLSDLLNEAGYGNTVVSADNGSVAVGKIEIGGQMSGNIIIGNNNSVNGKK